MFTVLLCMFAGIAVGWLLRNRDCGWASKTVTVLIWALLFLLGVEVGGNRKIDLGASVARAGRSCHCGFVNGRQLPAGLGSVALH